MNASSKPAKKSGANAKKGSEAVPKKPAKTVPSQTVQHTKKITRRVKIVRTPKVEPKKPTGQEFKEEQPKEESAGKKSSEQINEAAASATAPLTIAPPAASQSAKKNPPKEPPPPEQSEPPLTPQPEEPNWILKFKDKAWSKTGPGKKTTETRTISETASFSDTSRLSGWQKLRDAAQSLKAKLAVAGSGKTVIRVLVCILIIVIIIAVLQCLTHWNGKTLLPAACHRHHADALTTSTVPPPLVPIPYRQVPPPCAPAPLAEITKDSAKLPIASMESLQKGAIQVNIVNSPGASAFNGSLNEVMQGGRLKIVENENHEPEIRDKPEALPLWVYAPPTQPPAVVPITGDPSILVNPEDILRYSIPHGCLIHPEVQSGDQNDIEICSANPGGNDHEHRRWETDEICIRVSPSYRGNGPLRLWFNPFHDGEEFVPHAHAGFGAPGIGGRLDLPLPGLPGLPGRGLEGGMVRPPDPLGPLGSHYDSHPGYYGGNRGTDHGYGGYGDRGYGNRGGPSYYGNYGGSFGGYHGGYPSGHGYQGGHWGGGGSHGSISRGYGGSHGSGGHGR